MRVPWSLVATVALLTAIAVPSVPSTGGAQGSRTKTNRDRVRLGAGVGQLWSDDFDGFSRSAALSVRWARFGDADIWTDIVARAADHSNGNPPDCGLAFLSFSPCARVKASAALYTVSVLAARPLAPATGALEPYVAGGLAASRGRVVRRVRIVSDVCYLVFACVPPESLGLGGTMVTRSTVTAIGPVLAIGVNGHLWRIRVYGEGRAHADVRPMRIRGFSRQITLGLRL